MKRKVIITLYVSIALLVQVFAQNSVPQARSGYSLTYDAGRGVVVLFGGQDTASKRLNDTWEWANGT